MTLDVIRAYFKPAAAGEKLLVVGMEMAGGVIVGQCAALAALTHPDMLEWCDFVYCRKEKKKSGTNQQLEGPQFIVDRRPDSPSLNAVFLDDALSSGGSLRDGAVLLKGDYNIELVGAIYLFDRSKDRATLPPAKLGTAAPELRTTKVLAHFDMDAVDPLVPRKR